MKSNQPSPVWPYLGILVGLFAIAVSAPRGWETLTQRESVQTFLDRHPPGSADQLAAPAARPAAEPARSQVAAATPPRESAAVASREVESDRSAARRAREYAALAASDDNQLAANDLSYDSADLDRSRVAGDLSDSPEPSSVPSDRAPADNAPSERAPAESAPYERAPVDVDDVDAPPADVPADPETSPVNQSAGPSRVPRPERLFTELVRLSTDAPTAAWALAVQKSLDELCATDAASQVPGGARPVPVVLEELRGLGRRGESLAATLSDARLQSRLLRAQYALTRRVEIWEVACKLPAAPAATPPSPAEEQAFAAMLARLEQHLRERPSAAAWHEYLLLDRVASLAGRRDTEPRPVYYMHGKPVYETSVAYDRRQVAREVLDRLAVGRMSPAQRRYVEAAPLVAFQNSLHAWVAEPVDPQTLLADMERYEQSDKTTDGRRLAEDCRQLNWSSNPAARRLGAVVDGHYRNANVRLAVAAPFLNRFVPQPTAQVAPVRDVIAGADVSGRSTTLTKLTVLLVPDPKRLRLGLEAHGVVNSSTSASSGPATFYNDGQAQFIARKLFLIDARGLNVFPAIAEADTTRSDMVSLETNYDGVPLVGSIVRNAARSQAEERQGEARFQTEYRVATRARTQLDAEISKAVDKLKDRFNTQLWDTLARLDLDLQPIALSTSEDRVVLRLRLACDEQLAAYTPRPRAPSDSLMSLQISESALNNALARLELEGRSFTLADLFAHLRYKLNRSADVPLDADLPEDVVVTFAPEDAVRVSCRDGRVLVRLAFAELSEGRHRWRNFAVVTHYRPDSGSLDIHFVRDGTIFLEGESLKGKPQVTLRSIFSKVLSAQRGWGLLSPEFATDPRLEDVTISQFTVDEGWIGLAYAQRPTTGPVARKPK